MINKKSKDECKELAGKLFDIREEVAAQPEIYNDTKDIHYLLAVIAGYHGASVDQKISGPADYAHAEQLLKALFANKNEKSKDKIAEICCKLHKIICGHCACH